MATGADDVRPATNVDRAVQRLAVALLLLAARRYPETVRSALAMEWNGELHAIVHGEDRSQFHRDYWALLYSGSLAVTALSNQARQAGVTLFGATKRKVWLIVVVLLAVSTTAAIVRAVTASADATARDADRRDAYAAAQAQTIAATAAASAATACRSYVAARDADADNARDACYAALESAGVTGVTGNFTVWIPRAIAYSDAHAQATADRASTACRDYVAATTARAACYAALESARAALESARAAADRADAASTRARDAAHADAAVAFAATAVFVIAFAFASVKIRRARHRLRS